MGTKSCLHSYCDSAERVVLPTFDTKCASHSAGLPTVSAIIPAYNAEKLIHRAIESALAQTHPMLQILVVDDGSSDGTARVAAQYPVTVITKPNGGPATARNIGIKHATAEWIAFLDHDDTWHPNKTELQLSYVNETVAAVFCEKAPGTENISFKDMFRANYGGNPSSTIIRRSVLEKLGGFDEDPTLVCAEDYNLWLRFMLEGYRFATTPHCYSYTPADLHLSADAQRMLECELVNIDKIGRLAGLAPEAIAARKLGLRRRYIPSLIGSRKLRSARKHLLKAGLSLEMVKYWIAAYCPPRVLDLRRQAVKLLFQSVSE